MFGKAEDKSRRLSADDEAFREQKLREKFLSDQKTQMDGARIAGKNEGKTEKAIEIAMRLLEISDMSVQEVSKYTGLPLIKVKELKKK